MEEQVKETQAVGTHVGYGRNKGDGSDAQNQQPVDSLNRYTDESDAFFGQSYQAVSDSPYDMDSYERNKENVKGGFDKMFEKSSPQFSSALNAINKTNPITMIADQDNSGCRFVSNGNGFVSIDQKVVENNGDGYFDLGIIMQHEFTHAIDYRLARILNNGSKHASDSVKLESTGGLTLLQCAEQELGQLDSEFAQMLKDNAKETDTDSKLKELKERTPSDIFAAKHELASVLSAKSGVAADEIERQLGNRPMEYVKAFEESRIWDIPSKLIPMFQKLEQGDLDSAKAKQKEIDDWYAEYSELMSTQTQNDNKFEKATELMKQFAYLNDIMSASNKDPYKRGRSNEFLGQGHDFAYYADDGKRATEIFADIGPTLSIGGKAAEWLKEKAPKLVAGYFELLNLATKTFSK